MRTLRSAWAWARQHWWALVLGLLAVGTAIMHRLSRAPRTPVGPLPTVRVPSAIRQRVEAAEEAALRTRIETQVETQAAQEELARVAEIPDGVERRQRLAEMLRRL